MRRCVSVQTRPGYLGWASFWHSVSPSWPSSASVRALIACSSAWARRPAVASELATALLNLRLASIPLPRTRTYSSNAVSFFADAARRASWVCITLAMEIAWESNRTCSSGPAFAGSARSDSACRLASPQIVFARATSALRLGVPDEDELPQPTSTVVARSNVTSEGASLAIASDTARRIHSSVGAYLPARGAVWTADTSQRPCGRTRTSPVAYGQLAFGGIREVDEPICERRRRLGRSVETARLQASH